MDMVNLVKTYIIFHDDVIKWKHFPRYWPLARGIQQSPVVSPHKRKLRGALVVSLIGQTVEQTLETPVIWDAIALIMMSLWCKQQITISPRRHCDYFVEQEHWGLNFKSTWARWWLCDTNMSFKHGQLFYRAIAVLQSTLSSYEGSLQWKRTILIKQYLTPLYLKVTNCRSGIASDSHSVAIGLFRDIVWLVCMHPRYENINKLRRNWIDESNVSY